MSCCGSAGTAADDDDDDDAAADGAGFVVAVGGAAWGVLLLILVLFSVGATDVSPPSSSPMSGAAERLRALLPPVGAGAIITCTVGVVSFHPFPLS